MGFWLEIVTLLIPGFNDSNEEIKDLCQFLASVSPEIPWHATAYHPDYKMSDNEATPVSTLMKAAEIGTAAGLKYIYLGNRPGQVGEWENTRCPECRETLVEQMGFHVLKNKMTGRECPSCHTKIPGRWTL